MMRCCVTDASKTNGAMSNTSSVNVRNRPHFTLINLFHYYTWRNYFGNSPQTKTPPVRYSLCGLLPPCSSTQILSWCHALGFKFFAIKWKKEKEKKHSQHASSVTNFTLSVKFLKASLTSAVLLHSMDVLRNQNVAFRDSICGTS